jgi:hypothetical protein
MREPQLITTGTELVDRALRALRDAIVEIVRLPWVGAAVLIEGIQLPAGAVVDILHGLGRPARGWVCVDITGALAPGGIVRHRNNNDERRYLSLQATGYGATVNVSLLVF